MKMANIDAVFDFMFTSPKKEDGVRISQRFFSQWQIVADMIG